MALENLGENISQLIQRQRRFVSGVVADGARFVTNNDVEEKKAPTVADPLLETLDYDGYEDHIHEIHLESDPEYTKHDRWLQLIRLAMMLVIGMVTALVGLFAHSLVEIIFEAKTGSTLELMSAGNNAGAYFAYLFLCLAIVLVSTVLTTFVAPEARGSGTAYILAYLNGWCH